MLLMLEFSRCACGSEMLAFELIAFGQVAPRYRADRKDWMENAGVSFKIERRMRVKERLTVHRGGGIVGRGVESMQHLFTPRGEAVLRLHPLQQLQQPLLFLGALPPVQHVLIAGHQRERSLQFHANQLGITSIYDIALVFDSRKHILQALLTLL